MLHKLILSVCRHCEEHPTCVMTLQVKLKQDEWQDDVHPSRAS
jgi:hypothetical protein